MIQIFYIKVENIQKSSINCINLYICFAILQKLVINSWRRWCVRSCDHVVLKASWKIEKKEEEKVFISCDHVIVIYTND